MNDEELERELRRAAEIFDPPAPAAVQAVIEAFALHTLDAELAALTFDSLEHPVRVRGDEQPRLLTFQCGGTVIELEISTGETSGRIVGQLLPPQQARIEVNGNRPVTLTADPLGRFSGDHVIMGAFSLSCHLATSVITTEWITL
ncbi:hypothetical protein AB0395_27080 [Streptosporangium sp. NPDC051023]|uniref:hypothetical protein n=1 Tax=Streptosporangium sp. NPDC051023 TaxID=3155410 RepID=UPI00344C7439